MDTLIHILVVDDNHENLRVVSNFLKEQKYKIALATDGNSALEVLEKNPIDLVLLDVMMPGMDGYEVCRQIKENKKLAEIPIIFLTARNNPEDIVAGFEAGGVDYLTKPFIRDELLIRVKTHIELSLSRKKLIETVKTRDKLYSIIAHDIRAPLASISMLIYMLNDDENGMKSDLLSEVMPTLTKTVHNTGILLDNLLKWTRLQTDNITLTPQTLEISPIVEDCVDLLKGNANEKNISVESKVERDLIAFFDEVTIHTVFRNLLSNAIKFTPDNGSIIISAKPDGNFVSVTVEDTGKGMTEEVRKKIFDNDEIHTTYGTKQEKGSGLGLRLVKDLVSQNKGKLTVESELNVGTRITVSIPVSGL